MIYAQLNEDDICIGISILGDDVIENESTILLKTYDESILGKKYDRKNKKFVDI